MIQVMVQEMGQVMVQVTAPRVVAAADRPVCRTRVEARKSPVNARGEAPHRQEYRRAAGPRSVSRPARRLAD